MVVRARQFRFLAAFTLAACSPGNALAAEASLGGVSFEAPEPRAGWVAKPTSGGMIYQRQFSDSEGGKNGAALIQISPANDAFDTAFARTTGTIRELAGERPHLKSEGKTASGHRIRSDERCCARLKGISVGQRTVGIGADSGQVFLALVKLGLDRETRKSVEAEFAALVRSVKLAPSDKPFALSPTKGDGGLDGVFTHLETGLRPNAFGGTDFYSENRIKVFDASGLFSTEIPKDGDMAGHCRRSPRDCGLYRLKGGGFFSSADAIEMREVADDFGTFTTETRSFSRKGEDLTFDKAVYRRVPPFKSETPFAGTWRYFFASSGSMATSSGSVAIERTLALGRDGRFARTGWSGASTSSAIGDTSSGFTSGGRRPGSSGRYRVRDFMLELTDDDGKVERLSLFAPDIGSDKLLVIDGANYLKKE